MSEAYDDYYQSGRAEADWAEFLDDMFQLANEAANKEENDE